jgi:hypothetical protein
VAVDYALRFLIGGTIVSLFALLGDMLRPKSFAGLFGAAPSVAIATLGLAFWKHGGDYAAVEGRSMLLGAVALAIYSLVVCQLLIRAGWPAPKSTIAAVAVWVVVAASLKQVAG